MRAHAPDVYLLRSHLSFSEDRNETAGTLSAHSAAMFSDGMHLLRIGYSATANAESRAAARSGAGVAETMNSSEAISGDISMGPTPDATVGTPSAAGAASAEGTPVHGTFHSRRSSLRGPGPADHHRPGATRLRGTASRLPHHESAHTTDHVHGAGTGLLHRGQRGREGAQGAPGRRPYRHDRVPPGAQPRTPDSTAPCARRSWKRRTRGCSSST